MRLLDEGHACCKVLTSQARLFSSGGTLEDGASESKSLQTLEGHFDSIPLEKRNKKAFHTVIAHFNKRKGHQRGHVEFINAALKRLEEYGLHKDLDTYKALLNVFPKGALIPRNSFQKIFLHYPLQQHCCVAVLDKMEWFGVQPDKEVHDIVANAFGEWNFATKKIKRMLYWMPKLKNTNKFLDRRTMENVQLPPPKLALAALRMMARDPGTTFSFVSITGLQCSEEDQWIVSAQSPLQKRLLRDMQGKKTLYVDGPNRVYVMEHKVLYVTLTADPHPTEFFDNFVRESEEDNNFEGWESEWESRKMPNKQRNIHEQKDETILALAVLGRSHREWTAAWVNHLMKENPSISDAEVLFRMKSGDSELVVPDS